MRRKNYHVPAICLVVLLGSIKIYAQQSIHFGDAASTGLSSWTLADGSVPPVITKKPGDRGSCFALENVIISADLASATKENFTLSCDLALSNPERKVVVALVDKTGLEGIGVIYDSGGDATDGNGLQTSLVGIVKFKFDHPPAWDDRHALESVGQVSLPLQLGEFHEFILMFAKDMSEVSLYVDGTPQITKSLDGIAIGDLTKLLIWGNSVSLVDNILIEGRVGE